MKQETIQKFTRIILDEYPRLNAEWERERAAASKPSKVTRENWVWKPLRKRTQDRWTTYHIQRVLRENGIDIKTKNVYETNCVKESAPCQLQGNS